MRIKYANKEGEIQNIYFLSINAYKIRKIEIKVKEGMEK